MPARSLVNKLQKFSSFVYRLNYQIIAITETWLTSSIYDNEILPCQYTIYCSDRKSRGGGIMIAINQSIPSEIFTELFKRSRSTYTVATVTSKAAYQLVLDL